MAVTTFPTPILAVSDGSLPARRAVTMGGEIARATGSKLHVATVALVSRYIYPDILSPAQVERIRSDARTRLEADVAEAKDEGIEIAETHLRMGRVDAEILKLAEEIGAGLIVVGNRSADAVQRILLGDTAESVVRHAHCPVLVVRPEP